MNKQLYATRYYEAALGITLLVQDPEQEDRLYMLHYNRSRLELLRSGRPVLVKVLYGGVKRLLLKKMQGLKVKIEHLFSGE